MALLPQIVWQDPTDIRNIPALAIEAMLFLALTDCQRKAKRWTHGADSSSQRYPLPMLSVPVPDLVRLIQRYHSLFGWRGGLLMLDRFVRHVGRRRFYPRLAPLLWREPKSFSHTPQRLRPALSNAARPEPAEREWFLGRFPEVARCVIQAAERVSQHVFDFLGTGSVDWGDSIDWHQDVQIGYRWPLKFYSQVSSTASNAIAADPKIPWELSRLHHFVTLGQAYWLTDDRRWSDEFFAQWESWLASNPCPYGINWTSAMDVAIRVVNLMWGCALVADAPGWTGEQDAYLNHSLRQHGLYIEHNLEIGVWDGQVVTASHYLANIVGLLCLGLLCSELPEAARWRRAGLRALMVEIERQILPDGANYEASTSYHRLAVEFFTIAALLCRRCGVELPRRFWERLERAYEYILYCTQPDGQVPAIGDGDDGRLLILSGYPVWERNDHRYLLAIGAVLFERADFRAAVGDCPADLLWLLGREGVESFDALPLTATSVSSRAFPEVGVYVIAMIMTMPCCALERSVPMGWGGTRTMMLCRWCFP